MDQDPDADPVPAIYVSGLQDHIKKLVFIYCFLLFEDTFLKKFQR
jgi:hypothetical protein